MIDKDKRELIRLANTGDIIAREKLKLVDRRLPWHERPDRVKRALLLLALLLARRAHQSIDNMSFGGLYPGIRGNWHPSHMAYNLRLGRRRVAWAHLAQKVLVEHKLLKPDDARWLGVMPHALRVSFMRLIWATDFGDDRFIQVFCFRGLLLAWQAFRIKISFSQDVLTLLKNGLDYRFDDLKPLLFTTKFDYSVDPNQNHAIIQSRQIDTTK